MSSRQNDTTLYVDGEWRSSSGTDRIAVRNPATEDVLAEVPSATADDVSEAVQAAESARYDWRHRPAGERGAIVRDVADVMREHKAEIAAQLSEEQGKSLDAATNEVEISADLAEYMAEWDRRIEGDILPGDTQNESIHLQRHPLGVVAGIVPWNYPIAVFIRKFAPALVTGNTLVAKPSEVTPLSTLVLVDLIDEHVDIPDGVFNLVTGGGDVGEALVTSPDVDMISMTGSVETGKAIMEQAASNLTKVSLELGGKAPAIVWKDADIDEAVEDILTARITNAGQVCTCAERVYVHSEVREEFEAKYVDAAEGLSIGPGTENPDMGPQVSSEQLEKTEQAVQKAVEQGAKILTGGSHPDGDQYQKGYWYSPTVLTNVNHDMEIMHSEVFGPVSPIMEVDSLEEALEFANDSEYGLSAYVFSDDYQTVMHAAEDLEFGELYINRTLGESWQGHHIGWKESGMGGEDGKYGLLKYTQLKTVYHNYD